jgi:hypothetical protein
MISVAAQQKPGSDIGIGVRKMPAIRHFLDKALEIEAQSIQCFECCRIVGWECLTGL